MQSCAAAIRDHYVLHVHHQYCLHNTEVCVLCVRVCVCVRVRASLDTYTFDIMYIIQPPCTQTHTHLQAACEFECKWPLPGFFGEVAQAAH